MRKGEISTDNTRVHVFGHSSTISSKAKSSTTINFPNLGFSLRLVLHNLKRRNHFYTTHLLKVPGPFTSLIYACCCPRTQPFFHHHHNHHHVVPLVRISLTLSLHFSLAFIASSRSSGLHPVSSQSCCLHVPVGRPAFAPPYVGVHRSSSLMSSPLLLQQCPACLVLLTWIVFVMRGR